MFLETAKHSGMICSNHVAEPFRQRPSREFWTQERGFNVSGNQNEDSSRERLTIKIARRWMTNFLKVTNTAQKGVVFPLKKEKKNETRKWRCNRMELKITAHLQSYRIENHCPYYWLSATVLDIPSGAYRRATLFSKFRLKSSRRIKTDDDGWPRLGCDSAD